MDNGQDSDRFQQLAADMVAVEREIEEALVHWLQEVKWHTEAAEATSRFRTMVEELELLQS